MILEQNKANIETYGDVQQNKVSIDPRNAEHIISILSSNLYSNPEESFLRETISNAVDAHKEAGTTEPIILLFKRNGSKYDIVIRDYGTGISPERFDQIYKFIGSSTKRESNDYIGSFGIGRFASLACADVVNITSYYNGTVNSYIMAKNGGGIDIDLVASSKTTEKNGVEIKIQVDEILDYTRALSKLSYIQNLFVKGEGLNSGDDYRYSDRQSLDNRIENFNNRKILSYKTFKHNSNIDLFSNGYRQSNIILGDIVYPIDLSKINPLSPDFLSIGTSELGNVFTFIQVPFEIGSLDVTPNREALLYSPRTIEALKKGYIKALLEIKDLYIQFLKENTNILDYWSQCRNGRRLILSEGDVSTSILIPRCLDTGALIFKGKPISNEVLDGLDHFLYHSIDSLPISFVIEETKGILNSYWKKKTDLKEVLFEGRRLGNCKRRNITIVRMGSEDSTRSILVKSYISNKYKDSNKGRYILFVPSYSFKTWVKFLTNTLSTSYGNKNTYDKVWLLKEVIRALSEYIIDDDVENSEAFLQWKEDRKQALKNNKSVSFEKPVLGQVYTNRYWAQKFEFKNLDEFQKGLKSYTNLDEEERNRPVIYGELHNKYWDIFEAIASSKTLDRFIRVKTAQSNIKYFKGISKKWIYIEDYLPKMKEFRTYLTYRKYHDNDLDVLINDYYSGCARFMDKIHSCITEKDAKAISICRNYIPPKFNASNVETLNEVLEKYKEVQVNMYDDELKNAYTTYYKYINLYKKIANAVPLFGSASMLTYFLMKHKLLRMDFSKYIDLKNQLKIIVE